MILDSKKTWICNKCHTVNAMSNKKCMTCGTNNPNKEVFKQANSVLHSAGGATYIEPKGTKNSNWFCPKCGRKNRLNYCPICGEKRPNL